LQLFFLLRVPEPVLLLNLPDRLFFDLAALLVQSASGFQLRRNRLFLAALMKQACKE
jgi:hypothetical protein